MHIELNGIGKKFGDQWIFKDLDLVFESGCRSSITGPNGSGKSTLLKIISGYAMASSGTIEYASANVKVERERIFKSISMVAPYLDLYPDLSASETIDLQSSFKPLMSGITPLSMLNAFNIGQAENKAVKDLSSGMKQRLKLALALFSDTDLLLLDEPTSNLDEAGVLIYQELMGKVEAERSVIVCTNEVNRDAAFCTNALALPH